MTIIPDRQICRNDADLAPGAESPCDSCPRSSITYRLINRTPRTFPIGPAADRVLCAWHSADRCPNHVVLLLEGRRNPRLAAAIDAGCRRLRCPVCLVRRRGVWLAHLADLIADAAAGGTTLFLVKLRLASSWPSLQKKIQRHHGQFARVLTTNAGVVVVTTACVAGIYISASMAIEELAVALEDVKLHFGGRHRPISTSAGWRLNERRGSGYRRKGLAPRGSFRGVMQRALESGMPPRVNNTTFGKTGKWLFPETWDEAQLCSVFR